MENNTEENILNDLYPGLEKIADDSYSIFLESFEFAKNDFAEAAKFEAHIAALFYIDYCMAAEDVSENIRVKFYKLSKAKIIDNFQDVLSNDNLAEIIDYRYYDEYSQIPIKRGEGWIQSFQNLYEIKLKGTKNSDNVEKLPAIKMDEGDFDQLPQRMLFIRDETSSIYKAAKLVRELFMGKDLQLIMKEIEKAELEIKKEFQGKG